MKNGINTQIEYMASDDTERHLSLANTDVIHKNVPLFEKAVDPEWIVHTPGNNTTSQNEWMLFRATDGTQKRVRTACYYHHAATGGDVDQVICSFVVSEVNGDHERDPVEYIWFIAPNKSKYRVKMLSVQNLPGAPRFEVDQYVATPIAMKASVQS